MRFLVDENLPCDVADVIEKHGHEALCIADSADRGASDDDICGLAIQSNRIIITRDLDFSLRRDLPPPGVILIRAPSGLTIPGLVKLIEELVESALEEDLQGKLTVVSPGRTRSRSL